MTTFSFANSDATATLSAALSSGATSIAVVLSGNWPATNTVPVLIDSEIIWVTAPSNSSPWTIARGQENTTPAPHAIGAVAYAIPTAAALNSIVVPSYSTPLTTQTVNYTLLTTDGGAIANAAGLTITLPSAVVMGNGKSFLIKNGPNGSSTIVASNAGTIDGNATYTGLVAARAGAQFVSDGTNWNVF